MTLYLRNASPPADDHIRLQALFPQTLRPTGYLPWFTYSDLWLSLISTVVSMILNCFGFCSLPCLPILHCTRIT